MSHRSIRQSTAAGCAALLVAAGALGQEVGGGEGSGAGQGDSSGGQSVTVPGGSGSGSPTVITFTPGSTTTTTTTTPPVGYPAPGTELEGHLPSSSRAITDTSRSSDGFDLNRGGAGAPTVHGDRNASFVLTGKQSTVPPIHVVKKGDTLWDLCGNYYGNSWQWPRVWSYNPQIQNPHWIYPGDQVRMRPGTAVKSSAALSEDGRGGGFVDRRALVPANTVFLRNQGYIDDPKRDVWGELVGSREDQMLLSDGNNVYMILRPGVDVRLGQLLTVFRSVRTPRAAGGNRKVRGEIVKLLGSVKVDQWDPRTRIARGKIVESLDVIERGAKVAPLGRRFDVVPPRRNDVNLKARVLTSVYPHVFMAANQLVFIDRGSVDGLEPGNRLFIVKKGDTWRRSLKTSARSARERVRTDVPESVVVETTPLHGDERRFPEEIIGELRVLRTREHTSVALVTVSHREISVGDRAIAKKGY